MNHIGQDWLSLQALASAMSWLGAIPGGFGKGGKNGDPKGKGMSPGGQPWLQQQAQEQHKAKRPSKPPPATSNIKENGRQATMLDADGKEVPILWICGQGCYFLITRKGATASTADKRG